MKISRVRAVNFKGIKNIDVLLKKHVNKVTGANGAGKSSFRDSIMATLCGAKYTPDIPVRIGQNKAEVTVDMGDYIVHGIYTKSGRTIEVESPEGIVRRPQEMLDKCIGPLTFDPIEFYLAKAPKQVAMLKELVQVDFKDLNQKQWEIKQKRSAAKTEKERLLHEARRIQLIGDVPDEEMSFAELTVELKRIIDHNTNVKQIKQDRASLLNLIDNRKRRIEELQRDIEKLKSSNERDAKALAVVPEKTIEDETEIQAQIADYEKINQAVREKQCKQRLVDAAETQSKLFSELGRQIKALESTRAERLAQCDMPVAGLSLTDDYVTFGELPLKQVNTGEQLKICVQIAMQMNPTLKTVFVKVNDLDENNLKILEDLIIEKDYQALFEMKDLSGKIGIVIEDGQIKQKE